MKKVIVISISLILIGLGLFLGRDYILQITSKQGEFKVESQPTTTIFINSDNKGTTPYEERLDPGQYEVRLVPDNEESVSTWQQTIDVNSGTQTFVKVLLGDTTLTSSWEVVTLEKIKRGETELAIFSQTDASEIFFDGENKGTTPLSFQDIPEGEHEIKLVAPGFEEKIITVAVTPGYKLTVSAQLALVDEEKTTEETKGDEGSDKLNVQIDSPSTGWLRVREKPSTQASEVAKIDDGEVVTVLSEQEDWYEIEYEDGKTGWISSRYTKEVEKTDSE